jgi:hypothetical protein
MYWFWQKIGLGYILGDVLIISSGHPGKKREADDDDSKFDLTWKMTIKILQKMRTEKIDLKIIPSGAAQWYPGLPNGIFLNQTPYLGIFWRALKYKMLKYFMALWNMLRSFGICYGHFGKLVEIWYIFLRFGMCRDSSYGSWDRTPIECIGW